MFAICSGKFSFIWIESKLSSGATKLVILRSGKRACQTDKSCHCGISWQGNQLFKNLIKKRKPADFNCNFNQIWLLEGETIHKSAAVNRSTKTSPRCFLSDVTHAEILGSGVTVMETWDILPSRPNWRQRTVCVSFFFFSKRFSRYAKPV